MSNLGEIAGRPILAEHFYRLGDLPIMTCVLVFADDLFVIGLGLSEPEHFDADIARGTSRRDAKKKADRILTMVESRRLK